MKINSLLAVLALAGSVACATDYKWNLTSGTGSFQTDSNWTNNAGVPGAADRVFFTSAGTYGVSFADHVTNVSATVGTGANVTFDLGGYGWQLTNTYPFTFTGAGTARFDGGTLELTQTNMTAYPGPHPSVAANQKLILNNGTSVFRGYMSTATGGTLEVYGGNHSMLCGLDFYAAPSGGVSFRMTNGTVTVDYTPTFPGFDRRITVQGSAKLSLEGGTLTGKKPVDTYAGSVIDVYTNAAFNPLNAFNFARSVGVTRLNIYGGSVSNAGGVGVGMARGATGLVHLADGLLHSGGNITLGGAHSSASNSVAVLRQSGGLLRIAGNFNLGNLYGASGVYTQEGGSASCALLSLGTGVGSSGQTFLTGGTLVSATAFNVGSGSGSVGRFSQSGGGAWCNQLRVGVAAGATGEVFLTGGTLAAAGASAFGATGSTYTRLFQSGGELIVSNSLEFGGVTGSAGICTNTGGSVWLGGMLYVGNNSNTLGRMFFGGSSLEARGGITVGNYGSGTGELTLAGGLLPMTNANLSIGNSAGAVGTVEISGGTNLFNYITAGNFGVSTLRITGGYTHTTNRIIVGCLVSSTGRVELVGGVLAMPYIDGRHGYVSPTGGYAEVLFDGGTLRPAVEGNSPASRSSFVSDFSKATLTARGAVIDTVNETLVIPQALSNETGHAGSFTKKGAARLTLTSTKNGFTGRVAVEEGELVVSGNVYLTGGVAVSPGALLSIPGTVSDALTASGTVSRIDGALVLKAGGALTNGLGASLSGSGVVTGRVVFASGSAWARDKADDAGPLRVTAGAAFQSGVTVNLTGYSVQDLEAGIPLVSAASAGAIETSGRLPVTLDGAPDNTWWATLSNGGTTLTAHVIPFGTLIKVK